MVASSSPTPRKPATTRKPSARSGNPATRARAKAEQVEQETHPGKIIGEYAAEKVRSTVSSWKKATDSGATDVELPSGNVALLRRVSPEAFISKKMIPDSIAAVVQQSIESKQGLRPKDQQEMLGDPQKIADALKFMDAAVVYSVLDPQILEAPENESDRDEQLLYIDQVDLNDKIFIFNWASGGSSDLARFRAEFGDAMAGLDAVQDVQNSTV